MTRAAAQLAEKGDGRCALAGALTLETVPWLWKELGQGDLLERATEVDLAAVSDVDSAGLALLIVWRASCRKKGGDIRFAHLPARLLALAKLTNAEGSLLSEAEPAAA
jgi:phospholipid transport system transporter-binding protein